MKDWLSYAALYRQPRVLGILILGFSSGLPFLLTLGTLHTWLKLSGVSNTVIGFFALATIPYAFKFLWAPFIDHISIPLFNRLLGKRRSWILVSQIALIASLLVLGALEPEKHLPWMALMAFLVAFCASFQDNAIEAYRIELLPHTQLGPGASASVLGFRLGMWVSGGGALYLAHIFESWSIVYALMSFCILGGLFAVLVLPEPDHALDSQDEPSLTLKEKIHKIMIPSILDFIKQKNFALIIIFIVLFKIGDTVLNMMSIPFLIEIGFNKLEIANIAKTFGIVAMVAGGLFAGFLQFYKPSFYNLAASMALLVASSLMFMLQAYVGNDIRFLTLTMGIENFACGMAATALISYLSTLCHPPHTATHFAMLSSFCSFARIILSMGAGWLADQTDWFTYFALIGFLSFLSLVWLLLFGQQIITYHQPKYETSK